jgi:hypothetical protein
MTGPQTTSSSASSSTSLSASSTSSSSSSSSTPAATSSSALSSTSSFASSTASSTSSSSASAQNLSQHQAAQTPALLNKKTYNSECLTYGVFSHKIQWELVAALQYNTVIVQKVEVSYGIRKADNTDIKNITKFTLNGCLWDTWSTYWEAWCIRAGEKRPTSVGRGQPSFAMAAAVDPEDDDNYSTQPITGSGGRKGKKLIPTKGWVQYLGKAILYK